MRQIEQMPGVFHPTPLEDPITKFSLFLMTEHKGVWKGFGSGVIIGDGLALTAKHVIQNAFRQNEKTQFPGEDLLSRGTDTEFAPYTLTAKALTIRAIHTQTKLPRLLMWEVETAWMDAFSDLALLRLQPSKHSANVYFESFVGMTAEIPPIGQTVAAFGYHSPEVELCIRYEEYSELAVRIHPTTTTGEVLAVAESSETAIACGKRFPGYRTEMVLKDSMSGGPVFNEAGELCGLISSTFVEEDGASFSYIAALWPLLCLGLTGLSLEGPVNATVNRVQDLCRFDLIYMRNWRAVNCERPDGCISIRSFGGKSSIAKRCRI